MPDLDPIVVSSPCAEAPELQVDLRIYKPGSFEIVRGTAMYRVRFEVEATVNIDEEIFVHRKRSTGFGQYTNETVFSTVAKVVDMVSIPAGGMYNASMQTRTSTADILFPTMTEALNAIIEIRRAIEVLISDMAASYCIEDGGGYSISLAN